MPSFVAIFSNNMPLDIALGFLGAIIYAWVTYTDLTIGLLLLGALFALLPDVDFLVSWMRKEQLSAVDHTHRDLLHHPLPYLAVGGLLVWLTAPDYTLLFLGLSVTHFIHDSIGVGWGIPWLSPLSRRYAKFFALRDNTPSWTSFVLWTQAERDALIARYHNPDWLRATYTKITVTSIVEYVAFLLGLLAVFLLTRIL